MNELFPRRDDVLLTKVADHWPEGLHVGTCSWKYDDWRGLLYSNEKPLNHLLEYARHLDSVEVDQWFWSLFGPDRVVLPREHVVESYLKSVPDSFRFTVKAPNSISLTHLYRQSKSDGLVANPHFLSTELYAAFLEKLAPMLPQVGLVMLQFEYLNRQKMAGLDGFIEALGRFVTGIGATVPLAVECRNPNFMKPDYFDFLKAVDVAPVFCQGYYMPPVTDLLDEHSHRLGRLVAIRLMGPDRDKIEQASGARWDAVIDDRTEELTGIVERVRAMLKAGVQVYVNVNNHYEGSAPLTIKKMAELFGED